MPKAVVKWQNTLILLKTTGYNLVDGLCGVNCRHSFMPFYPGITTPRWSPEDLRKYEEKTYAFTGEDGKQKTVDAYAASQLQRGFERELFHCILSVIKIYRAIYLF